MPMANVSTGQVIAANDHNSIVAAIKGTAGENLTVFTKGVDLASASALILGTDGNYWHVVGTATITSISSLPAGTVIKLEFDSALTLTHNGTSLILSGAVNVTTSGGDVFEFTSEGSGNWRETGRGWAASALALRGTPSLTFGTTNNQGSGSAFLSRNATIALFDTTAARAVAFGDVGTTGGVNFASPRDHGHAFALGATVIPSTGNLLSVASTNGNLTWTAPAVHTAISNGLLANVSIASNGPYYDGPSVAQGTTGTWFASGKVYCQNGTLAGLTLETFAAKLWDGTTVVDNAETTFGALSGQINGMLSLSGYFTNPAGNIRISAAADGNANAVIRAATQNYSVGSMASTITVVRIA